MSSEFLMKTKKKIFRFSKKKISLNLFKIEGFCFLFISVGEECPPTPKKNFSCEKIVSFF